MGSFLFFSTCLKGNPKRPKFLDRTMKTENTHHPAGLLHITTHGFLVPKSLRLRVRSAGKIVKRHPRNQRSARSCSSCWASRRSSVGGRPSLWWGSCLGAGPTLPACSGSSFCSTSEAVLPTPMVPLDVIITIQDLPEVDYREPFSAGPGWLRLHFDYRLQCDSYFLELCIFWNE